MLFTVILQFNVILDIALPHSYGINFICAGLTKGLKCELKSPADTLVCLRHQSSNYLPLLLGIDYAGEDGKMNG